MRTHLLALSALLLGGSSLLAQGIPIYSEGKVKVSTDVRLTMDGAIYLPQSDTDNATWDGEDFRFSSGTNITQARLGLSVQIGERWSGKFDAVYQNRRVALADNFVDYTFDSQSFLKIGYYKDPLSMEANTSSKFLNLQTPMAINLLTHGERYMGLTYYRWGKGYWLSGGVYAGNLSSVNTTANRGGEGYGVGARANWLPIDNEYTTILVGASGRWRTLDRYDQTLTLSTLPESPIDNRRFVHQSIQNVRSYWAGGLELAVKYDKFFVTGEYLFNSFKSTGGSSSYASGWFARGSYMLRGNQRTYVRRLSMFNPTGNVAKGGNIELIGQISGVKGNDFASGLQAGKATSYLIGANWYPNRHILVGLNYSYMDQDENANGGGLLVGHSIQSHGLDFHTIQARVQLIF